MIGFDYDTINFPPSPVRIIFVPDDIEILKKIIDKTPPGGVFKYKGAEFLREYAIYLTKFLEMKFKSGGAADEALAQ